MNLCRGLLISLLVAFSTSFAQAQSETVNVDGLSVTFTTIDVPGAMNTNVTGINSLGQMAGYYAETTNGPGTGFVLSDGTFTFFNYPSANSTLAFDINDSGLICGIAYVRQNTASVGFLYDGASFTTIRAPGKTYTYVEGINNSGVLAGSEGQFGGTQGFELFEGRIKNVTPPGSFSFAYATGANNLDDVVGFTNLSAFVYKGGRYQTFELGDGSSTTAWDVNDSEIVVGSYTGCVNGVCFHSFAAKGANAITIDFPGALETFAFGINNAGQVVGSYTFDYQTYHGFVTSPIVASNF